MKKTYTVRLYPTNEQEILMKKHIGSQRYIYNWALDLNNKLYQEEKRKYTLKQLGKMLTQYKKQEEVSWLNEISYATLKQSLRNLDRAYTNFYSKRSNFPKFKNKKNSKATFYSRYEKVKFYESNLVNLEKIGKVKYKSSYNIDFTLISKFSNPTVTRTVRCWILNFAIDVEPVLTKLENKILAIDLGVKKLAITNLDKLDTSNINKTKVIKNIETKLKRLQRQCSKKYLLNKKGVCYQKTMNIAKLELKIRKLYSRLHNIRNNYIHQATSKMVKSKPRMIVMEDLNVSNMLKNKHLSKLISNQCFHKFIEQIKYKCEYYNIQFIQAPWNYPSSKKCSCCGNIKRNLKLSDRVYACDKCKLIIDRDKNASYNLVNYGLSLSSYR